MHRFAEPARIVSGWSEPALELAIDDATDLFEKCRELFGRALGCQRYGHWLFSSKATVSTVPEALTKISTRFSAAASSV